MDSLGSELKGMRILDLCSGSGGVGIEALSCGARHVVFVELEHVAVIQKNLDSLGLTKEHFSLLSMCALRAVSFLASKRDCFDLIYIDPPYFKKRLIFRLLNAIRRGNLARGMVILETEKDCLLPESVVVVKEKTVRGNKLLFLKFLEEEQEEEQGEK